MNEERQIKRLLSEAKPPEAPEALERTAAAARSAAGAGAGTRQHRVGRLAIASLCVAAAVVFSFTPPGRAVTDEVAELVGIGEPGTIDHNEQGGPFEPTTDEIVVGTGTTADGERFELVAFEAEHSEEALERRREILEDIREQAVEIREEMGEEVALPHLPDLPRNVGTCISLDWIDRPDPLGGGTCIDGPQRNPLSISGTSYDARRLYGPAARLLILGMTGREVARVEVTYERAGGESVVAKTTVGRITDELAEQVGTSQQFGLFVALVPAEDVHPGGPFADGAEMVRVVAYGEDGQEIKRELFDAQVAGLVAERARAGVLLPGVATTQMDTTTFEVMRAALNAGQIEEGQNPCTYPGGLRREIGLSARECDGALGRDLAQQHR